MPDSPATLLQAVQDAARTAGESALRHFRRGLAVEWKADGSEVTAADRIAEEAARGWIARRFPRDTIVGEEFGGTDLGQDGRAWYIDPIDGTRSFVRGIPLWGSMVAVAEGGSVLAGAIHCPATGDLVAAAVGEGCWHNGARCAVSAVDELAQATVLATDQRFRAHPERQPRWEALARAAATSRTWGDCYGYVLIATGRAEVMADDRLSPWDAAPLVPIIAEAGGVLTDWRGRHGGIPADAVATNTALADAVRRSLGIG